MHVTAVFFLSIHFLSNCTNLKLFSFLCCLGDGRQGTDHKTPFTCVSISRYRVHNQASSGARTIQLSSSLFSSYRCVNSMILVLP